MKKSLSALAFILSISAAAPAAQAAPKHKLQLWSTGSEMLWKALRKISVPKRNLNGAEWIEVKAMFCDTSNVEYTSYCANGSMRDPGAEFKGNSETYGNLLETFRTLGAETDGVTGHDFLEVKNLLCVSDVSSYYCEFEY